MTRWKVALSQLPRGRLATRGPQFGFGHFMPVGQSEKIKVNETESEKGHVYFRTKINPINPFHLAVFELDLQVCSLGRVLRNTLQSHLTAINSIGLISFQETRGQPPSSPVPAGAPAEATATAAAPSQPCEQ